MSATPPVGDGRSGERWQQERARARQRPERVKEVNPTSTYVRPGSEGSVDLFLDPLPRSVAVARHAVGRLLESARISPSELAEDVLLLVSELVTNGVLHAGTVLRVAASVDAGRVLVTVEDDDPQHAPRQPQRGALAASGRGLRLVDILASSWGVHVLERSKVVWFEAGPDPVPSLRLRRGPGGA